MRDDQPTPNDETRPADDHPTHRSIHTSDPPLQECLDHFWTMKESAEADHPDARQTFAPYDVLKRLGPSPFQGSTFPLIGFLASAYERVSRFAGERTET